jgi:hypothetical protein
MMTANELTLELRIESDDPSQAMKLVDGMSCIVTPTNPRPTRGVDAGTVLVIAGAAVKLLNELVELRRKLQTARAEVVSVDGSASLDLGQASPDAIHQWLERQRSRHSK